LAQLGLAPALSQADGARAWRGSDRVQVMAVDGLREWLLDARQGDEQGWGTTPAGLWSHHQDIGKLVDMTDRLRALAGHFQSTPTKPQNPRIAVDLVRQTITLGGTTHDIASKKALRWVKVLVDHPGDWISGRELERYDDNLLEVRTDRLKHFLPNKL